MEKRRGCQGWCEGLEARRCLSAPRVEITTRVTDAQEDGQAAVVHLRRVGGSTTKPLGVKLTMSGSAKAKELRGEPELVTFPARRKTIDIAITATDDGLAEKTESATFTIVPGKKYRVTALGKATIRVLDAPEGVGRGNGRPPAPVPTPTVDGPLKWTQVANAPVGRAEPESAVVNGRLYAFSGYTDEHWQPIRRVDRYDLATNTWTRMADMPVGVTHAATAVVGTKVWLAGGYAERVGTIGNQDISIDSVWIYDTVANTWSAGPSLPQARGSGGLGLIGNTLYFTAGETRQRVNQRDTWALDLNNPAIGWKTRAPIPQGRTHFGTVVLNGQLYVMGGQDGVDAKANIYKTAYRYDPASDTWTRLADLPYVLTHISPATVVRNGKIYMFGGEEFGFAESRGTIEYDPATNKYRSLTALPATRAAAIAGLIDDKFVFSSGLDGTWHDETFVGTFG